MKAPAISLVFSLVHMVGSVPECICSVFVSLLFLACWLVISKVVTTYIARQRGKHESIGPGPDQSDVSDRARVQRRNEVRLKKCRNMSREYRKIIRTHVYLSPRAAYSNGQGRTRLDFTGLRHAKAFQCEQQQSFRYELNS